MSDCVKENESVREKKNQNFFLKIMLTWKFVELTKKVRDFGYIYIYIYVYIYLFIGYCNQEIDPCKFLFFPYVSKKVQN